ncbi:putative digeranylgeranylglyceryl phosphate synthase protein [Rosellinia necatrix]|uniref:Putative digeranylgeranylglyceryl phosphate synthase protein n=1 Tax=Rosellinia necatrix TaxID=77044 RepID=A0A1S7UI33_ROSNE|nr:putative digeranylgeranylglyceryl phosphate synthase protein [Rosellinia necatrix]
MTVFKEEGIAVGGPAKHIVDGSAHPAKLARISVELAPERCALDPRSVLAHLIRVLSLIWAFTEGNFITFVLPNTTFGVLSALAGQELLQINAGAGWATPATVLRRTLLVMAFNWANVLIFDLQNQTAPQSLEEDLANKPWRPIPSGHITVQQTRQSMFMAIPLCLALNGALGVEREGLYIQIWSYVYNELQGGDSMARDVLITIAYSLFNTASLRIAAGSANLGNPPLSLPLDGTTHHPHLSATGDA